MAGSTEVETSTPRTPPVPNGDLVADGAVETGVRIWSDGCNADSQPSLWISLVASCTLLLYTGWIHILLMLMVASCFYVWPRIILALLFGTLLLPARPVLWTPFNRCWIFSTWRRYFRFSYLFEEVSKKGGHYVFVEFPHGVFPMGPLLAGTVCQVLFPDIPVYSLAANSVFRIPMWRHFVAAIGSMPATSANFKRLLRRGSLAVIVGGIAEMFMQHPRCEQVKLRDRKGFVRLAVEEGTDGIVPVYHFGNTQLLDIYPKGAERMSRKLQAAVVFLVGRWGLPLPRKHDVWMVTGKAIAVKKMAKHDPGFDAEVDRVHALVVDALQGLYDRHKAEFGWADRPLKIT